MGHKTHNVKILKSETYKLITNYNITGQHDAFGNEKIGYGYGVRIDDNRYGSMKIIEQAGKGLGFVSMKFYIQSKDINVIVLENVFNENQNIVYHFENKIRELILNSSLVK